MHIYMPSVARGLNLELLAGDDRALEGGFGTVGRPVGNSACSCGHRQLQADCRQTSLVRVSFLMESTNCITAAVRVCLLLPTF